MRLSKRGEYGLRAMINLADSTDPDKPYPLVQIKDISERENIPAKFLEQILLALKNAGLLQSKMGFGGGYYLARPPAEINLGRSYASWTARWRPSAVSARWHTNPATARMNGPAVCGW
jgi:Rrf2 family protein